jgi:hypothetical protein
MTVWKPLTCDCILEYDNNKNFLRAFSKCSEHEKLQGKRLLAQVVKDNISRSKAAKPRKSIWARLRGK